jgi:hypothetical protein
MAQFATDGGGRNNPMTKFKLEWQASQPLAAPGSDTAEEKSTGVAKQKIRPLPPESKRFPLFSSPWWRELRQTPVWVKLLLNPPYRKLRSLRVFERLLLSQRVELTVLVVNLGQQQTDWQMACETRVKLKRALRRERECRSKVKHVVTALNKLADYADGLADDLSGDLTLAVRLGLCEEKNIPSPELLREEAARYQSMYPATLSEIDVDIEDTLTRLGKAQSRASFRDQTTSTMVDFFLTTCGLSKGDANRRTGLISNAFFGSKVAVRVKWEAADLPPSCEAVRLRVRRAQSRAGHSQE